MTRAERERIRQRGIVAGVVMAVANTYASGAPEEETIAALGLPLTQKALVRAGADPYDAKRIAPLLRHLRATKDTPR